MISSFTVVCLLPHSNKGVRRSCGSSRSGSSADTMRSRCAGRRSGGARSTSRSGGTREPRRWPRCELQHQLSLGCGSPSLRTAQCKQVFILPQAAILTYSRSQMHNPGNVHSLNCLPTQARVPCHTLIFWLSQPWVSTLKAAPKREPRATSYSFIASEERFYAGNLWSPGL